MTLVWQLQINWNGDGATFSDEGDHLILLESCQRGRQNMFKADGRGFEWDGIGQCALILDNEDGRYDAWNTSSPLYPNVTPGKKAALRVTDGGVTYPVFAGMVDNLVPLNQTSLPQVRLTLTDPSAFLRQANGRTYAAYQNTATSALLNLLLYCANYPWSNDFGTRGSGPLPPYYWSDQPDAWAACNELSDAYFGRLWIGADGTAHYSPWDDFFYPLAATTLQQSQLLKEIAPAQPWDNLHNKVSATLQGYTPGDPITYLWSLPPGTRLGSGEQIYLAGTYTGPEGPCAIAGGIGFDCAFYWYSDGTGTNLTSQRQVTGLTNNGMSFAVWVKNLGPYAAYLCNTQVYGQPLLHRSPTQQSVDWSAGSLFGTRQLSLQNPWGSYTSSFLSSIFQYYSVPRPFPVISMEAQDSSLQFGLDLTDAVQPVLPALGINQRFRIGRIEHRWLDVGGQAVRTSFWLEPMTTVLSHLDTGALDSFTLG